MQRVLILGAGFAGLWSAAGAARACDERGIGPDRVEITVVNATPWHSIRVRNYEADLSGTRVRLADILEPIGVKLVVAEVTDVSVGGRIVTYKTAEGALQLGYDRLVFALGSRLVWPPIPGLHEHAFNIDTYEAALRLGAHLTLLSRLLRRVGRDTVLVIGAGLTGIEVATELASRRLGAHVILADMARWIGSDMGDSARPVIAEALEALGVETRTGVGVTAVDAAGADLTSGERIAAETVVWCAGMQANPLTTCFPVARDRLSRLPVRPTLQIEGLASNFAAGDVAWFAIDGTRSCRANMLAPWGALPATT
jgi:NADH dehydrogenase